MGVVMKCGIPFPSSVYGGRSWKTRARRVPAVWLGGKGLRQGTAENMVRVDNDGTERPSGGPSQLDGSPARAGDERCGPRIYALPFQATAKPSAAHAGAGAVRLRQMPRCSRRRRAHRAGERSAHHLHRTNQDVRNSMPQRKA